MNIHIDSFWLYGYRACELGKYQALDGVWRFMWNDGHGDVYESVSTAVNELLGINYRQGREVLIDRFYGEEMIYIRIEASQNGLNPLPSEEVLSTAKGSLVKWMGEVGFKNLPEPRLYFTTTVV